MKKSIERKIARPNKKGMPSTWMLAGKKQSFSWHHTEVHTMPMDWCLLFANSLWLHAASQMLVNFVFTVSFHFSFFLSLSLFLSVFLCPDSTHSRSPSTVSWCTLFIWFLLFCYLVSSGASSLFDAAFRSWLCVWCAFFSSSWFRITIRLHCTDYTGASKPNSQKRH